MVETSFGRIIFVLLWFLKHLFTSEGTCSVSDFSLAFAVSRLPISACAVNLIAFTISRQWVCFILLYKGFFVCFLFPSLTFGGGLLQISLCVSFPDGSDTVAVRASSAVFATCGIFVFAVSDFASQRWFFSGSFPLSLVTGFLLLYCLSKFWWYKVYEGTLWP